MIVGPGTLLIVGLIGGIGTVVSFGAFKVAQQIGPKIEPSDLLPAPFPYPPLPRFIFTKPELLAELRK